MLFVSFDFCEANINAVREANCPVVLTNRYLDQRAGDCFDYIYVDHTKGMKMATQHLIDRGCRNIVLITGNLEEQTSRERFNGYIAALNENGIDYDEKKVLNGGYSNDITYKVFGEFLSLGIGIDGVVASNDLAGFGIVRKCNELNINIPNDIKLVSFDNTDYAKVCNPQFTSIDMRQYQIGYNAAQLLIERIEGRTEQKNIILEPELIVRESSM